MNAVPSVASRGESRVLLAVILLALAAGVLWFLASNAWHYTNYSLTAYTPYYWGRRGGLIPHIAGGVLAITAGLIQLWLGLTHRTGTLHRTLGKVYGAGVLLAAAGAYYMVFTIPAKYLVYGVGLFGLATAWLLTTSMALVSIYRRNIEQHRDWMLRSYTVTFAFVTFRLIDNWLTGRQIAPGDSIDAIMAWACWSVPLLLLEPLIQLRRIRGARRAAVLH